MRYCEHLVAYTPPVMFSLSLNKNFVIMATSLNSVFECAHKGDYDLIKSKVDDDPVLISKRDDNGRILLHWAALSGNLKLVTYLLDQGSVVDAVEEMDATPLILAASAGRIEIVAILISKGANVNHKTTQGHSALQYACSKGWLEISQLLLEKNADVNITDIRGATPLHRAASKGNLAIVKILLLNRHKLKVDEKDVYGCTPLHLACEEDRQEEAKLLIQNGADLYAINKERKTPLDLCTITLARILKM